MVFVAYVYIALKFPFRPMEKQNAESKKKNTVKPAQMTTSNGESAAANSRSK